MIDDTLCKLSMKMEQLTRYSSHFGFLLSCQKHSVIPKGTVIFCPTVRVFHSSSFSHFVFYESLCEQCFYPHTLVRNKTSRKVAAKKLTISHQLVVFL